MSAFSAVQNALEKHIGPVATKLSTNNVIKSMSAGMMGTMPITLGVAFISIAINLPIPGWMNLLNSTGISLFCNMALTVTMNMLALYLLFCISSHYGKSLGIGGTSAPVMAMGIFLVLMPIGFERTDAGATFSINTSYLGSKGIFIALVISILVPKILSLLLKRVSVKLPDSVPPIVGDSLSPTFAAIIMFTSAVAIKIGFVATPWGNIFDMVNTVVAMPIMHIGSSPIAPIFVRMLGCSLWFFGVHPSAISSLYTPVMAACNMENIDAFLAGQPLPHLEWAIVNLVCMSGGTSEGIGLLLSSLTARAERYKAVSRLSLIPAVCNITEPLMFGIPAVLNPVFFIPMVLVKPLVGFATLGLVKLGLGGAFNPTIMMPWITPVPITGFMQGGFELLIIVLVAIALSFLLYLPFFRMADDMALEEERKLVEQESAQ